MEQYMDDYNSYKRYAAVKCKCKCPAHCGYICQECEYCPDCECKECAERGSR